MILIKLVNIIYLLITSSFSQASVLSIKEGKFILDDLFVNSGTIAEGFLITSCMLNGIIDGDFGGDFQYKDIGRWDGGRNFHEFVLNIGRWQSYGLNGFTLGLQGDIKNNNKNKILYNNVGAFHENGDLDSGYMFKLGKVLDETNRLNMIVILSLFDNNYASELKTIENIIRAVKNILYWLSQNVYRNIIIEPVNDCAKENIFLNCDTIINILSLIKSSGFLAGSGVSSIPSDRLIYSSDVILLDGVYNQGDINSIRKSLSYQNQPIIYYKSLVIMLEFHIRRGVSYGYYDKDFENLPVDWNKNTERQEIFFEDIRLIIEPILKLS